MKRGTMPSFPVIDKLLKGHGPYLKENGGDCIGLTLII